MLRNSKLTGRLNDIFGTYILTDTITPQEQTSATSEISYSYSLLKGSSIYNCIVNIDNKYIIESKIMPKSKAIDTFEDSVASNKIGVLFKVFNDKITIELANLPPTVGQIVVDVHFVCINKCIGNNIIHFDKQAMQVDKTELTYIFKSQLLLIDGEHSITPLLNTIEVKKDCYFKFDCFSPTAWSTNVSTNEGLVKCILVNHIVPSEIDPTVDITNKELCVFVDCSGSMEGNKLTQCILALKFLIASLPATNVSITIYAFSSSFIKKTFTSDQKEQMIEYVKQFKAIGSTNINDAIYDSFCFAPGALSFIITDGRFDDSSKVRQRLLHKNNPLFIIGIGNDVDSPYLQGLINDVGGRFNIVPQTNIVTLKDIVVSHLLSGLYLEKVNLFVKGGDTIIEELPKSMWNLRDQHNLKYLCIKSGQNKITEDDGFGEFVPIVINGEPLIDTPFEGVDKIVMGKFIEEYNRSNKDKAVELSIRSNILSNYTSYVGEGFDIGSIGVRVKSQVGSIRDKTRLVRGNDDSNERCINWSGSVSVRESVRRRVEMSSSHNLSEVMCGAGEMGFSTDYTYNTANIDPTNTLREITDISKYCSAVNKSDPFRANDDLDDFCSGANDDLDDFCSGVNKSEPFRANDDLDDFCMDSDPSEKVSHIYSGPIGQETIHTSNRNRCVDVQTTSPTMKEYTFDLADVTIIDEIIYAKVNGILAGAYINQIIIMIIGNNRYEVQVVSIGSEKSTWSVYILSNL